MELSRRSLLQIGGLGALAVGGLRLPLSSTVAASSASLLDESKMPRPYRRTFAYPPNLLPAGQGEDELGKYATYVINQVPATARVLPSGQLMHGFGYNGTIPGPTIHVERGTRVIAKVRNRLPERHPMFGHEFATSTHLHGNASLPEYDGYASDVTRPGQQKIYQWPTKYNAARTLWYHDHGVHHTAENVYSGLAGQYHIHDATERALLPSRSRFDVPLTVSDVMFAADGNLGYDDRLHSGLWGDVILVNGVPWPVMQVQRRVYRFRMLNASISRSYRPTLFPQGAVHMVGTDAGLMPRSREVTWWRHGTAERYEFLIDFRNYAPGTRVELRNLSNDNNRDYDHTDKIMAFDVTDEPVDTSDPTWNLIPDRLTDSEVMNLTPGMAARRRHLRLKKSDITNRWSINDRTWEDVIASGFREVVADPDLDDVEIWTFDNRSGGWFHPVHTHLVDQKILSRNGAAPFAYELGPKDVIYVGEGEAVDVIMKFGPHRGRYMIHCHNLPHEDHDMMVQFSVGLDPDDDDPHHPIAADPAKHDYDGDDDIPPDHYPPGYEPHDPDDGDDHDDDHDDDHSDTPSDPGGAPTAPPAAQLPAPKPRRRRKKRKHGKGHHDDPKRPRKPRKPRKPRRPRRPRRPRGRR